jgi:uracil-DNA glycosylase
VKPIYLSIRYAPVADGTVNDLKELRSKASGSCSGCPRNKEKLLVLFSRRGPNHLVDHVIVSQEPGFWLRSLSTSEAIEQRLANVAKEGGPSDDLKRANPLSRILQIFSKFDPADGRVYWTHALKCVPVAGDRDINKEWRKAATRCEEYFLDELRMLGKTELNVLAFGKYALELCLHALDGQDIDQELSISEFMQSSRLPISFKHKFKDGTSKTINLFVFTNPSSEVVKVMKSGGKMTVEEIQDLEIKRIQEMLRKARSN